jgi:hypothetical protein
MYSLDKSDSQFNQEGIKMQFCTLRETGEQRVAMVKRDKRINDELTDKLKY